MDGRVPPSRRCRGDRHPVLERRSILIEAPAFRLVITPLGDVQERRRTAKFEPEGVERKRQPHAAGLYIGFLQSLVREKAIAPAGRGALNRKIRQLHWSEDAW